MNEPTSAAQVHQSPPDSSSPEPQTAARPNRSLGKPLTAKQKMIWDMKRPVSEGGLGKKSREIASALNISIPVVSKTLVAIYKKLGIKHRAGGQSVGIEVNDHEKTAALIDAATTPEADLKLGKIREALREAGLPPAASEALIRRLRTKFYGAFTAVKNLKTQEILDLLGQKIHLALTYMDDKVMGEASFRDLALGSTAMIEKRQLLRGEPTQIISDHERAKIHELVPKLLEEARRRGLTIEGEVTGKLVEPIRDTAQ